MLMRVSQLAVVLLADLAACGDAPVLPVDSAPGPDGPAEVDWDGPYQVVVEMYPIGAIDTRIAGERRYRYETTLANEAAASQTVIRVDNLVDGVPAMSVDVAVDCDRCTSAAYSRAHVEYCAYTSGELRFGSIRCGDLGVSCVGDGFCDDFCFQQGGCSGEDWCGLRHVPWSPSHGWLDCVPPGSVPLDGACTVDAKGVDDCEQGSSCHEGICRWQCFPPAAGCPSGTVCVQPPTISPEVGVCLPPPAKPVMP